MTITMEDVISVIETQKDTEPDFVSKNGAWLLTVIGIFSACVGGVLTYFLRSRCKTVRFGCIECQREVVPLEAGQATISTERAE